MSDNKRKVLLFSANDGYQEIGEVDLRNFPVKALDAINEVLQANECKYPCGNWRNISIKEHLMHAKQHITDWLYEVDTGEPHIDHALTRLAFAAELLREENKNAVV